MISLPAVAQKLKKGDLAVISNLRAHVSFLADDSLEGRKAGSKGEKLAMDYISGQFEKSGLQPRGDKGSYFQSFDINEGKSFEKNSYLVINEEKIKPGEFFPIVASPNVTIEASPSMALKETGVPWFLDLKDDLEASKTNPQFILMKYLGDKAKDAAKKGATALLVFNSDDKVEAPKYDGQEKAEPTPVPVVVVSNNIVKKYLSDETATLKIKLKVEFTDTKRTWHNVVGLVDNGAATTVIIGAHYDHLGMGEERDSMSRKKVKQVHNGADDNASGTAALIELSRLIKNSKLKKNNYLFIAFSGEEAGLFGSKYFVDHPTIDLANANYMLNLHMVGRLNDSAKTLIIGGYRTSPAWGGIFNSIANRYFVNKYDSSGTAPSDHISFYRKDIPVLSFFTGLNSDYHKPTDDYNKVNYTGTYRLIQYIYKLVESVNNKGRLGFSKTREDQSGSLSRFPVTPIL
ncbi:MAG: M20/M25/M40 family metallo-hydrolase [Chitinophagaceae bacterium]